MKKNKELAKAYWFAQSAPKVVLTRHQPVVAKLNDAIHMNRNGSSTLYFKDILKNNFNFEGIIPNLSPAFFRKRAPVFPQEYPDFSSSDVITLTTRPSLDDNLSDKRRVERSFTQLEYIVSENLRKVFKHCSRKHIILSDLAAQAMNAEERLYRAAKFFVTNEAYFCCLADVDNIEELELMNNDNTEFTIGYLVYIKHLYQYNGKPGPGLLTAFGLNGTATVLWSQLIWQQQSDLLNDIVAGNHSRVLLGKFRPNFKGDKLPSLISFDDQEALEIVADVELKDDPLFDLDYLVNEGYRDHIENALREADEERLRIESKIKKENRKESKLKKYDYFLLNSDLVKKYYPVSPLDD